MNSDDLRRLDRLAWILDSAVPVPGTKFRIGLDGLIGLVPGVGDAIGALLSSYIIAQAVGSGAPASVLSRMGLNVLLEAFVGLVPVLGDLFDFGFKANARNVRLLRRHAETPARVRQRSRAVVGLAAIAVLAVLAVFLLLAVAVLRWAWSAATGGT